MLFGAGQGSQAGKTVKQASGIADLEGQREIEVGRREKERQQVPHMTITLSDDI